jgi:hypothetical protein
VQQEKSATGFHGVAVRRDGKFWHGRRSVWWKKSMEVLSQWGNAMENSSTVAKYWETCHDTENLGAERNLARQEEIPKKKG